MRTLDVSEGYRIWAPTYSDETAISFLEDKLVRAMTAPLGGLRLLDAGCGTGRRLRGTGAARAIGLEPCPEMVAAGRANDFNGTNIDIVSGDVRRIPFAAFAFDVVWCRLVLGHLASIIEAYGELARVAEFGASLIVTDFHPAAVAAGHRRSFRAGGEMFQLEHHVHRCEDHIEAARKAGLRLIETRHASIGSDVRSFYEKAGRLETYGDHSGLPVVLAFSFRREQ